MDQSWLEIQDNGVCSLVCTHVYHGFLLSMRMPFQETKSLKCSCYLRKLVLPRVTNTAAFYRKNGALQLPLTSNCKVKCE